MNGSKPVATSKGYPLPQEKIGRADPLAPDYVGTYSPPALYKLNPQRVRSSRAESDNEHRKPFATGQFEQLSE